MTRGADIDHIIIRLAAEGVPQAAIARAICRSRPFVRHAILAAVSAGTLKRESAVDWIMPGTPDADQIPFGAIDQLAGRLRLAIGLRPQCARFVAALGELQPALNSHLLRIVSDKPAVVQQIAFKSRAALADLDISFEAIWGLGYRMDDDNRRKLIAAINDVERRFAA